MSILKKLIATAGVFALASASLVSASAATSTRVTIEGTPADTSNYSVCAYKNIQSDAVLAVNLALPSTTATNGDVYNVYINNTNNCYPLVNASASIPFTILANHTTNVKLTNPTTPATFAATSTIYNDAPALVSINGPKGLVTGDNSTYTICQNNTSEITVTFEDLNGDELTATQLSNGTNIQSNSLTLSPKGQAVYKFFPSTTAVANTSTFAVTFAGIKETTTATVSPAVTTLSKTINFSVVSDCAVTSTVTSSSKSSSSVSSMSSSSATVVASSTVAASSKAPTTVAPAPEADSAKGPTVRTGGVN
jgi:hypothetical protein